MRDRHFPRICRSCRVPMARQEDGCWRCGTRWASEVGPRTTLTLIAGGAQGDYRPEPAVAVAARAASDTGFDAGRWADEGGSILSEVAAVRGEPTSR